MHGDEVTLLPAPANLPLRAAVITLSDKGSRGEREDKSGPLIVEMLTATGYKVEETMILPDDAASSKPSCIRLADARQVNLMLTTGGTGFSPRDITPEATLRRSRPQRARHCRSHALSQPEHHPARDAEPRRQRAARQDLDRQPAGQPQGGAREPRVHPAQPWRTAYALPRVWTANAPVSKKYSVAALHPVPYQMQRFI